MDRKEYLEICQRNSACEDKETVLFGGIEYYPISYCLWFDKKGAVMHSAIMTEKKSGSELRCLLEDVIPVVS